MTMEVEDKTKSKEPNPVVDPSDSPIPNTQAVDAHTNLDVLPGELAKDMQNAGNPIESANVTSELPSSNELADNSSEIIDNSGNKDSSERSNVGEKSIIQDSSTDVCQSSSKPEQPVKAQLPLSFTIDFGDNKEVDTARYRNLFERYNARHRRNLSSSKIETKTKTTAPITSPNLAQKHNAPSTHSEGYFSSDQEDDAKRKADQLSQKLEQLGINSISKAQPTTAKGDPMSRSYSERSSQRTMSDVFSRKTKDNKPSRANLSLQLNHTLNDACRGSKETFRIDTLSHLSRTDSEKAEFGEMSPGPKTSVRDKDEHLHCELDDNLEEFGDLCEKTSDTSSESHSYTNGFDRGQTYKMCRPVGTPNMNLPEDSQFGDLKVEINLTKSKEDASDDAVSETGTYTIHKDYTDEEKARMDIDKVFSVGVVTEEESSEAYVHSFKMSVSRDNNWISEWATQVAEHNSLPSTLSGTTRHTPTLSPTKIPSPIYSRSRRLSRGRQEQSDSSLELESYLQAKEVTATVHLTNDHVRVDSGGESDDDTSPSHHTPPHISKITPTRELIRRGNSSEILFRRNNLSDGRRSVRNYVSSAAREKETQSIVKTIDSPQASSRVWHGRRNHSLDRRETPGTSDTNASRRSSLKNYLDNESSATSPILTRVKASVAKLTNSPILIRREPTSNRTGNLPELPLQAKNIGYFTCTENSPYMLRKSFSTASYHHQPEIANPYVRDISSPSTTLHQNSPVPRRSVSIQRSCSNASVRNSHATSSLARRSSFNNADNDRTRLAPTRGKCAMMSDSSSEAGDKPSKSSVPPISSGIKLNRAFSIRRARLNCESDTTPSTTPEERRKKAQTSEVKVASNLTRQQPSHVRGRSSTSTSQVAINNKEIHRTKEPVKPRPSSISRTDSGRLSMRAPRNVNHNHPPSQHSRPGQKPVKESHKKAGRSNSTLTAKEVEFQNWKRRKNYDPMKAAAKGKKKPESARKQYGVEENSQGCESSVLRSASFHGTGGTLSLAVDWSDEEYNYNSKEYIRPPPPSSPQLGSDSDLETSSYLRATENVMSAMTARMIVRHPMVDSGGESDEDTSHSLHRPVNRKARQAEVSDTESSDEPPLLPQSPLAVPRQNKTFGLPKVRLETREKKVSPLATNKTKLSSHDIKVHAPVVRGVSRTDSGRFVNSKVSSVTNQPKPKEIKKSIAPSSKELEMQNWKRRKSYDPMKAAMEGKRKVGQVKEHSNANSASNHVLRSQSFHGSVGLGVSDWSDEEVTISADEASLY